MALSSNLSESKVSRQDDEIQICMDYRNPNRFFLAPFIVCKILFHLWYITLDTSLNAVWQSLLYVASSAARTRPVAGETADNHNRNYSAFCSSCCHRSGTGWKFLGIEGRGKIHTCESPHRSWQRCWTWEDQYWFSPRRSPVLTSNWYRKEEKEIWQRIKILKSPSTVLSMEKEYTTFDSFLSS